MGELDADELLHLAVRAMQESRDDEAIGFLERALALAPADGRIHYLLGAVHAHLGMVQPAIDELERAVQLAPWIDTAHFQLGLLKLTGGDVESARATWAALDHLPDEHPLALFRSGMTSLMGNDLDACVATLRRGVKAGGEHSGLSLEMERVIATAERVRASDGRGASEEDVAT